MVAALAVIAALATVALATAALARAPGVNGPAEWRWEYREVAGLGWAPVFLTLGLVALFSFWDRLGFKSPAREGGLLALAVLLGWGLTLALAAAGPEGFGRVFGSLASRLSFGYVWDAGLAPPARELLADYPAASARLDLHARTHPPGALLAVRAADRLTRALPPPPPGSAGLAAAAQSALSREVARARTHRRPVPERLPGPWALVALALGLPALSALAAWPLARLARAWGLPPAAARLSALLWLAVPARSLFTPSLDQALPLLSVAALLLVAVPGGWGGRARAFAAGLVLFAAAFLSYGCLALLPWAATVAIIALVPSPDREVPAGFSLRRLDLVRPAALGLGFLLPWAALALLAGYAPWASFRTAMQTHRGMAVLTRGYLTWLLWNPYDLALLLGPPVLLLGLAALAVDRGPAEGAPRPASYRVALRGFWALLLLLWISGSVRGELGRIWLFFMPFACLFAADAIGAIEGKGTTRRVWAPVALVLELGLGLALAASMVFVS